MTKRPVYLCVNTYFPSILRNLYIFSRFSWSFQVPGELPPAGGTSRFWLAGWFAPCSVLHELIVMVYWATAFDFIWATYELLVWYLRQKQLCEYPSAEKVDRKWHLQNVRPLLSGDWTCDLLQVIRILFVAPLVTECSKFSVERCHLLAEQSTATPPTDPPIPAPSDLATATSSAAATERTSTPQSTTSKGIIPKLSTTTTTTVSSTASPSTSAPSSSPTPTTTSRPTSTTLRSLTVTVQGNKVIQLPQDKVVLKAVVSEKPVAGTKLFCFHFVECFLCCLFVLLSRDKNSHAERRSCGDQRRHDCLFCWLRRIARLCPTVYVTNGSIVFQAQRLLFSLHLRTPFLCEGSEFDYDWKLIEHPVDYQGTFSGSQDATYELTMSTAGRYLFKVRKEVSFTSTLSEVMSGARPIRRYNGVANVWYRQNSTDIYIGDVCSLFMKHLLMKIAIVLLGAWTFAPSLVYIFFVFFPFEWDNLTAGLVYDDRMRIASQQICWEMYFFKYDLHFWKFWL